MQRKDCGRDVGQGNLEEQTDDQGKNVSFCFINDSHVCYKIAFIINFRELMK